MSKVIDDRVVQMRFDNSNFESNVKVSMDTLEKLKASMNFASALNSLKGLETASQNMKFSSLAASVSNIESRFSILGIAGKRAIENITDSMMGFAKKTVGFLTSGVINGGISRAMKLEQAHFQLQGLLKDETAVAAVMQNVNDAVDGTAYGLDAAAKVASQLAASGMRAGDQMYSSLRAVAGVAAMTNSSYEDIGRIFTQVAGQSRLMGQDLLQLSSRGINAAATIADYLGKTESEVRDMVSKGKISFEIFSSAMDDAFGEHAKKANETFTGAMANVKASLARIGAEFVSPLIVQNGPLVNLLNTIRERINDIKKNISPLSEMFTGFATKVLKNLNLIFLNFKPEKLTKAFVNSVKAITNIFKGLFGVVKPIGEAFKNIFSKKSTEDILTISEKIKDLTSYFKISDEISQKMKRTFEGFFSILSIFLKVVGLIGHAFESFFTSGIVTALLNLFFSLTAVVGDFFTALNNSVGFESITNLFSGLLDVIGALLNGLSDLGSILDSIGNAAVKTFGGIGSSIKSIFNWIGQNISFEDISKVFFGMGIYSIIIKINDILQQLKGNLKPFKKVKSDLKSWLSLGDKFASVLDTVSTSLKSFTNGVKIFSLIAIAAAVALLSHALKTMSELKVSEIKKTLVALGIMMAMLTLSFKSIISFLTGFSGEGFLKVGVTMMMMAKAIGILADAMRDLSQLSFREIIKGLVGIGGGMMILIKGLKSLDLVEVKITTIIALSVMANSIKKLAESLISIGSMSWNGVAKGLAGMGGALYELFILLKSLEKIKFSKESFASVISIVLIMLFLEKIADALKKIGSMSWNGVAKGLAGMGGALYELFILLKSLEKIENYKSTIVGAVAIVIVSMSLMKIANALKKIGSMSWNGIAKGLAGMGGALAEIATAAGVLGKLTGVSSIIGSAAILIVSLGIEKIADALKKIGSMSWNGIAKGLAGMGGALAEIATTAGVLGTLAGLPSLLGAASIFIITQGLGDIADALMKLGSMSWEEIARSLTAMGVALGEIAWGGFLNTFSIIGSKSISKMAEPLGVLADSVKKWNGVEIPENLGLQLGELATGVMSFTFGGFGASAIAEVAAPLGTMADSVKKWSGVTVPEGIGTQMSDLAKGVRKFTFGGFGASAIAEVAAPLGTMADSVKKWNGVTVPEGMGTQMSDLAKGVRAFSFAFVGGWSLEVINKPLGELAGSVKKWNGVTVPEDIGTQLEDLAKGVRAFSFAFVGGWSLEAINKPLGELATSVNKWNGVNVPENLPTQISNLANSIKNFSGVAYYLDNTAQNLSDFPVDKLNSVISELVNLQNFITGLSGFDGSGVETFKDAISNLATLGVNSLVETLNNSYGKVQSAATRLIGGMSAGFAIGKTALVVSLVATLNSCVSVISSKYAAFLSGGLTLGRMLSNGLKLGTALAKLSLALAMIGCVTAVRKEHGNFYSAGAHLGQGLADGISSKKGTIADAARKAANAAYEAAKDELDEHSPSRVFYRLGAFASQGMANGITAYADVAMSASAAMANSVIENATGVVSTIGSAINDAASLDVTPTISPVLDMSELQNGNYRLNSSIDLALNKPIELLSNAMYGSQAEIIQSNLEVVDAIHGLKDDIVGGVKSAIEQAFNDLAKEPAIIESSLAVDGKQFAKATVEYYQNEVSKRSVRANRSRGIL